jgi:KDO2-lipid IV(A) lauroyltransferase
MYYIVYGLFYLISLLPLFILYRISDFAFFIIYHVVKYRQDVVMNNLDIAFPEKSDAEKKQIAKKFYKNFTDTFIETIKMISLSDKGFNKMVESDLSEAIKMAETGKSIQFHAGHQFNWELANWVIAKDMPIPFIGIYMKIGSAAINKIFYKLRSKKGTILVSTHEFKNKMHALFNSQYCIGLAADQNPAHGHNAYWLNFFGKPAPFVTGPEKGAIKNNTAVIFMKLIKIKRGKYRFETEVLIEDVSNLKEGELTRLYRNKLEETIRQNPDNYLWSHRRWKWPYKSEYAEKWIDDAPIPTDLNEK